MENSFTQGKIYTTLIAFAFPVFTAMLLQALYGTVDLLVVGRFGDATGVSAVSTGSQIMQINRYSHRTYNGYHSAFRPENRTEK